MNDILIYGAYGYTGKLIVDEALSHGLSPIVAGRNKDELIALANEKQLDHKAFSLSEHDKLIEELQRVKLVIHCAGPFVHTALQMVKACVETNTHYIDITGEYDVFNQLHKLNEQAVNSGIMLLPGAGFDVVPSDCLAATLKSKMPDAKELTMAFTSNVPGLSRGTAKSMVEKAGQGHFYRKDGQLLSYPLGHRTLEIDYGPFSQLSVGISWGDVATAYHSTGIPNIEIFTGTTNKLLRRLRWMNRLRFLLSLSQVKKFLKKQVDKQPIGPSENRRARSQMYLWGRVANDKSVLEGRLVTPNGYTLTAITTILIALKVLKGQFTPGYQTPSTAYGKELITEVEGCQFSIP